MSVLIPYDELRLPVEKIFKGEGQKQAGLKRREPGLQRIQQNRGKAGHNSKGGKRLRVLEVGVCRSLSHHNS